MTEPTPPLDYEGSNTRRLDRVEGEVATLTAGLADLRGEMRSVSEVLRRIESTITSKDASAERAHLARQPNAVAVAAALFSLIVTLVGGAWSTSGQLARLDERSAAQSERMKEIERRQWRDKEQEA